jgi:hypothetical protein
VYAEAPNDPADVEFWRTRADQLETALQSRIVIEQAKGVLAERFGCDPAFAFEILRRNARSNQRKIHELAADIVASTGGALHVPRPRLVSQNAGGGDD